MDNHVQSEYINGLNSQNNMKRNRLRELEAAGHTIADAAEVEAHYY